MRLTLESYGQKITTETPSDDLALREVFALLLLPALLAVGYSRDQIDDVLAGGYDIDSIQMESSMLCAECAPLKHCDKHAKGKE